MTVLSKLLKSVDVKSEVYALDTSPCGTKVAVGLANGKIEVSLEQALILH